MGRREGAGAPVANLGAAEALPGTLSFKLGFGAGVGGEDIRLIINQKECFY